MEKNKLIKIDTQISKSQNNVVKDIVNIINTAQSNALRAVNTELIKRNWLIGKRIDEEILTTRSNDYGKQLIKNLSIELSKYGKGFNKTDLYRYLNFYKKFKNIFPPAGEKSSSKIIKQEKDKMNSLLNIAYLNEFFDDLSDLNLLPWTIYRILIEIDDISERNWYENEARKRSLTKRELERCIKTDCYHRVLSNQLDEHNKSKSIDSIYEYLKSIYVFDFLNLTQNSNFKENDLENKLIRNLAKFIFELGKGFCFKGNQVHIRSNNKDYYIDLVFYNDILKRNLLIDLKVGKVTSQDIGQMELYLKLFDAKIKQPNDNPSIGLVLSSEIDGDIVKYMSLDQPNHILPSKYLTYLPTKQELINEIKKSKALLNKEK